MTDGHTLLSRCVVASKKRVHYTDSTIFTFLGFIKDCFGGFDHHRQLHLVLDSLDEIADIEMNGGKREHEEEEEPFRYI